MFKALHHQGVILLSSVMHAFSQQEVMRVNLAEVHKGAFERGWSWRHQLQAWHVVAMAIVQNHKDQDIRRDRGVGKKESLQRELQAMADLITG